MWNSILRESKLLHLTTGNCRGLPGAVYPVWLRGSVCCCLSYGFAMGLGQQCGRIACRRLQVGTHSPSSDTLPSGPYWCLGAGLSHHVLDGCRHQLRSPLRHVLCVLIFGGPFPWRGRCRWRQCWGPFHEWLDASHDLRFAGPRPSSCAEFVVCVSASRASMGSRDRRNT